MEAERHVRLFRNGSNQALRIPKEFELDADEAIIRRENSGLIIEPVRKKGLLTTLATLPDLEDDLPDIDTGLRPIDEHVL
ncbi:antitoxin [Desulfonatronum parangueonense]